ncbi:MAG: hypothetical protein ABIQ27_01210 [Flavobacterium sp.]|uniref:hypothetical protein n=1 Tax=Flavobacterium sp. TaxID=239 RepID=UPI0032658209
MKNLKILIAIMGLFVMMTSCSSESGAGNGNMRIIGKATYTSPAAGKMNNTTLNSDVVLISFKINVNEISFKYGESDDDNGDNESGDNDNGNDNDDNGDDNHDGLFNGDDEVALNGPWELDLLNQTTPITTIAVPNGTYDEVELELGKSLVSTSTLYNKTIEIRGTINGTPFVFRHDLDQELKIDYEDAGQNLIVNNNSFDLVFNFDLNQLLSTVDLSGAVDGNGNGIIEIGSDDTDGNNALALVLNQHLGQCSEMEGGEHGDGDGENDGDDD